MKSAAFLLGAALVVGGCTPRSVPPSAAHAVPALSPAPRTAETEPPVRKPEDPRFHRLTARLRKLARSAPGTAVAFWVEDRLSGRRWALNPDRVFRSASLIKIPVAALALRQWEKRPEKRKPPIEKRVWRTIAESHNVSTDVVVDHVGGLGAVNRFCKEQGWSHTRMNHKMMAWRTRKAHNLTTARDVAAMLRAIDGNRLVDETVSEGLWELLKDQEIVDRIPAGLPKSAKVQVGNKTGTMLSVVHDAGIVRGPGVRYLLVIMIDRPRKEEPADAYCRKVSSLVYAALAPANSGPRSSPLR